MPDPVVQKMVREVVRGELEPFRKEVRQEFKIFGETLTTNILAAVKVMIDEFRAEFYHEMSKNFDAVMGRMNKYDEEHAILRAQHHCVLDHEERLEKIEKMHLHPHASS